jgi:uncharacterized protein (DUF488 family)
MKTENYSSPTPAPASVAGTTQPTTTAMKLFTLGFTQKPAQKFFELLRRSGTQRVIDIRLNNRSQLAGFSKSGDLEFFLREVCGIGYVHLPDLAPSKELFDFLKKRGGDWATYAKNFLALMAEREIEKRVSKDVIADGCLLCSEDKPHHCHRRLVAEYLGHCWGDVTINHLI